jgi:uncharacterized protein (TIGR02145 family)
MPTVTWEGQTYNTVLIGNQCWFKENLNYEAGNSWCYNNNPSNCDIYGRLYNWATALTVCPDGWHLPSDNEWKILEGTVDSQYPVGDPEWNKEGVYRGFDAGKNLKSISGWYNNGNGTDLYGFSALPGGYRYQWGGFGTLGQIGNFWTSNDCGSYAAFYRKLSFPHTGVGRIFDDWNKGYSVRCVRDN